MNKESPVIIKHAGLNKQWQVRIGNDNNLYCTCPAWRFQKLHVEQRKPCKHITAFLEVLAK